MAMIMPPGDAPEERAAPRPARWWKETLRVRPAQVPVGHSVRSAVAVGMPFIVGAVTDHIITGMWIGLATLLLAAGEREGTYRLNFQIITISTPIAAAGYALGYTHDAPLPALIVLMVLLALLMGLLGGLGPAFSVGGMQFLLVAAIALGVEHVDWALAFWMYLVGAFGYAALLAVEMVILPARPQRRVLAPLLSALAGLARARATDPNDGAGRVATARARVAAAQTAAASRAAEFAWVRRRVGAGPRGWTLNDQVVASADHVAAIMLGTHDGAALARAADRLDALAARVAGRPVGADECARAPAMSGSLLEHRLDRLDDAVCSRPVSTRDRTAEDRTAADGTRATSPAIVIDSEAVFAATRLALAFGVAVAAKAYFPFNHWFWVPLTVCLVMKPDFGSVFSRAILRVLGTVAGAAIATAVILAVPNHVGYGIAIAVMAATVPWLMMRSYALQAVAIAPVVILLVDAITPGDAGNYAWQRIAATAIGGLIVIVFGYLIWPHSRRQWVQRSFSDAMDAIADQLQASASTGPGGASADALAELMAARRQAAGTLIEMHERLHRALAEPPPAETVARNWLPLVAAADRLATAVTAYTVDGPASYTTDSDRAQVTAIAARIRDLGHRRTPDRPGVPTLELEPVVAAVDGLGALLEPLLPETASYA